MGGYRVETFVGNFKTAYTNDLTQEDAIELATRIKGQCWVIETANRKNVMEYLDGQFVSSRWSKE